jgi:hypothetical protein
VQRRSFALAVSYLFANNFFADHRIFSQKI